MRADRLSPNSQFVESDKLDHGVGQEDQGREDDVADVSDEGDLFLRLGIQEERQSPVEEEHDKGGEVLENQEGGEEVGRDGRKEEVDGDEESNAGDIKI